MDFRIVHGHLNRVSKYLELSNQKNSSGTNWSKSSVREHINLNERSSKTGEAFILDVLPRISDTNIPIGMKLWGCIELTLKLSSYFRFLVGNLNRKLAFPIFGLYTPPKFHPNRYIGI